MKKLLLILSLCFGMLCQSSFAQAGNENFEKALANLHSMKSNFQQVLYDESGKIIQKSQGTMAIERPGKFRWYTHQPMRQLIVANDDKLWVYDLDLEQVTGQNINKSDDSAPAVLLSGSMDTIKQRFSIQEQHKKNVDSFKLTPYGENNTFQWVELSFQNNKLNSMRFKDNLGQITDLKFSQIKVNSDLNKKLFVFKPPRGVDFIDNFGK